MENVIRLIQQATNMQLSIEGLRNTSLADDSTTKEKEDQIRQALRYCRTYLLDIEDEYLPTS